MSALTYHTVNVIKFHIMSIIVPTASNETFKNLHPFGVILCHRTGGGLAKVDSTKLTISESQLWVLLVATNKNHGQPFVQYAERREPFSMGASYHLKEVPLKKGSREMIMPLF